MQKTLTRPAGSNKAFSASLTCDFRPPALPAGGEGEGSEELAPEFAEKRGENNFSERGEKLPIIIVILLFVFNLSYPMNFNFDVGVSQYINNSQTNGIYSELYGPIFKCGLSSDIIRIDNHNFGVEISLMYKYVLDAISPSTTYGYDIYYYELCAYYKYILLDMFSVSVGINGSYHDTIYDYITSNYFKRSIIDRFAYYDFGITFDLGLILFKPGLLEWNSIKISYSYYFLKNDYSIGIRTGIAVNLLN